VNRRDTFLPQRTRRRAKKSENIFATENTESTEMINAGWLSMTDERRRHSLTDTGLASLFLSFLSSVLSVFSVADFFFARLCVHCG